MYPNPPEGPSRQKSELNRAVGQLANLVGFALAIAAGPAFFNWTEPYVAPLLAQLYGDGWGRIMRWVYWVFCFIGAWLLIRASMIALWLAVAYVGVVYGSRAMPMLAGV
jgi:hypothetical protein